MPRNNMTGPMGNGPLTGRRMGYCASRVFVGTRRGVGRGRGMVGDRCMAGGYGFYPNASKNNWLEEEKAYLEEELKAVTEALLNNKED